MSFTVYGSRSAWCAICHNPPMLCRCERDSEGVIDLIRVLDTADHELVARQEVVRAAQAAPPACCPTCGQPMPLVVEPPKKVNESWRDREPLL